MFTTPEARPISNAQYEHAKQIEKARRWHKTGRSWLDFSVFAKWVEAKFYEAPELNVNG